MVHPPVIYENFGTVMFRLIDFPDIELEAVHTRKDGERRPRRDGERRKNDRRREERPEAPKAVNPRVRKTPKVEPAVEAPQVEEAAVETTEE